MFGFGKKKKQNILKTTAILNDAMEIFKYFHERENQVLSDLNETIEKRFNTKIKISTHLFYLNKYYLSPDYMGYALGFFEGMAQGKGYKNDDEKGQIIAAIRKYYGNTIVNYRSGIGYTKNEGEWEKRFGQFLLEREFESDEEAGDEMMKGLVEGKSFSDAMEAMNDDYAQMANKKFVDILGLPQMTHQLKVWFFAIYMDEEKFQYFIDLYNLTETSTHSPY